MAVNEVYLRKGLSPKFHEGEKGPNILKKVLRTADRIFLGG